MAPAPTSLPAPGSSAQDESGHPDNGHRDNGTPDNDQSDSGTRADSGDSDSARADSRGGARQRRARRTAELFAELSTTVGAAAQQQLRDQVVVLNRPVAEAVAARYRGRGIDEEDLRQAAYEGLIKAVGRFDVSRHTDLLTFAVPTIRGELQRYFRDLGWTVRPPRRIQELQWQINRATSDLHQQLGHDPTPAEIATHLGITSTAYNQANQAYGAFHPASLDQPLQSSSGGTVGDRLPDQPSSDPFNTVDERAMLTAAMDYLSPRDRHILYLRFWEERMQREIGEELGITQMQVSRILTRIYSQMNAVMEGAAS